MKKAGNMIAPLLAGLFFGFGLSLSQMMNRERVIGFLDVTGEWDPTLILVLCGAVGVTLITFRLILKQPAPICEEMFHLPTKKSIDKPLIIGALIFGVGWGIGGYCPGPGLAALVTGSYNPLIFVGALAVGSMTAKWVIKITKC
jgi:uncharacterized membrane protein YedE/YeeE